MVDLVLWVILLLMNLSPYVMCSGTWCQTTVRFRPDFHPIGLPYNFFDPTFYFAIFLCIFHFGLFIFACVQAAAWTRSAVRVVVDPDDEEYAALSGQLYRFYLDNASGAGTG